MAAASATASGSVATTASTLSSSATHLDWGSKGWTFSFYVRESSWEIFPLCSDSLSQIVLIVCFAGLILKRLSSGTLVILLGFELGSSLDFTVIFVRMLCMDNLYLLRPILELPETDRIIYFSVVVGRVGLMLVCCCFVDAWTALLLIMLKLGANYTDHQ